MQDETTTLTPEILPDEPAAKPQNLPKHKGKYLKKTLDAFKLIDAGLSPREAMQATNLKKDVSPAGVALIKRKYKKYSLLQPKTVKLAENQIKRILKGEAREVTQQKVSKDGEVVEYTEQIAPSDTNIIAAATMVYDRYEPVVKQVLNVNVDVDPVDLGAFKNE